jgi:hypothetical protein
MKTSADSVSLAADLTETARGLNPGHCSESPPSEGTIVRSFTFVFLKT